ncbi:aspartic proteinase nepenthesin-1-like [Pyrus ussuriensis x Pyrus communis]|uniref:Aspartic proteinase nepenthesin-1-like n=1 Tax=Pyrus ussuriensis x Pyrus communis TaxID=2448454 RepID=A0A5N5FQI4_9ROSA|nr:aspartic proteinase nepenthesin-1-like [Pyrus ussuriensis x Pyrus communis]
MEGTAVHHVICILSISFLLTSSPLYPGNISFEEEIHRLIHRSNLRAQHIDATIAPSPAILSNAIVIPLALLRLGHSVMGGQEVRSILAGKTFYFLPSRGRPQPIENLCLVAYDTKNMKFGRQEDFNIAGILGLENAPIAFPIIPSYRWSILVLLTTPKRHSNISKIWRRHTPTTRGSTRHEISSPSRA